MLIAAVFPVPAWTTEFPSGSELEDRLLEVATEWRRDQGLDTPERNPHFRDQSGRDARRVAREGRIGALDRDDRAPVDRLQENYRNFVGVVSQNVLRIPVSRVESRSVVEEIFDIKSIQKNLTGEGRNQFGVGIARRPNDLYVVVTAGFEVREPTRFKRDLRRALHKEVNRVRRGKGLTELSRNGTFRRAARNHARDMARQGYFAHESLDGTTSFERVRAVDGSFRGLVLENLTKITPIDPSLLAERVVKGWLESPGHRKNLLNDQAREGGFGVGINQDDNRILVAHNFGYSEE